MDWDADLVREFNAVRSRSSSMMARLMMYVLAVVLGVMLIVDGVSERIGMDGWLSGVVFLVSIVSHRVRLPASFASLSHVANSSCSLSRCPTMIRRPL